LVVAHRGEPLGHVENTLPAVLAGFALGADLVEIDLRVTSDGVVVAAHDDRLRRDWVAAGRVALSTWSELRALRRDGAGISSLAEVLAATGGPLMLDLGGSRVAGCAYEVALVAGALDRCLFVSGDLPTLSHLRGLDNRVRLGLTWQRRRLPDAGLLADLSIEYWNPALAVASRARVRAAHELGWRVSVWTVDHPWRMRRALRLGVDAVVTNQVARLLAIREGAKAAPGRRAGYDAGGSGGT
jgi:glycerophosphoryl diester phosphodiesterase